MRVSGESRLGSVSKRTHRRRWGYSRGRNNVCVGDHLGDGSDLIKVLLERALIRAGQLIVRNATLVRFFEADRVHSRGDGEVTKRVVARSDGSIWIALIVVGVGTVTSWAVGRSNLVAIEID